MILIYRLFQGGATPVTKNEHVYVVLYLKMVINGYKVGLAVLGLLNKKNKFCPTTTKVRIGHIFHNFVVVVVVVVVFLLDHFSIIHVN